MHTGTFATQLRSVTKKRLQPCLHVSDTGKTIFLFNPH